MKVHANAPLGPKGRETMVLRVLEQGWSRTEAAEAAGVSERTCSKWVRRYRADGERRAAGSLVGAEVDPAPHARRARRDHRVAAQAADDCGAEIAFCLAMALSTVSAVLLRVGLGKLSRLEPPEPPNRYERRHAGELLHVDVKKLGRIADGRAGHRVHGNRRLQLSPRRRDAAGRDRKLVGWEYVHVCVDDATRLAYVEVLADEKATTAVGFLQRAVAFYASHGVRVRAVMSDNGACYRSTIHAFACRALDIRHLRTRPYRPRTNGKAERFIRTLLAGWAYGAIYGSSHERTAALDGWIWTYNHRRPHGALSHKTPIARLNDLSRCRFLRRATGFDRIESDDRPCVGMPLFALEATGSLHRAWATELERRWPRSLRFFAPSETQAAQGAARARAVSDRRSRFRGARLARAPRHWSPCEPHRVSKRCSRAVAHRRQFDLSRSRRSANDYMTNSTRSRPVSRPPHRMAARCHCTRRPRRAVLACAAAFAGQSPSPRRCRRAPAAA